ncbi:rhamnulokinase [Rhodococcus opacus]|uniref:Rhamnulokinase n=1 Tax=Rhodococcus opacus TaxID=37919 RepID=A0AAX3Y7L5_RHOOP|nr:rhamnulokinase family protein [Rhodococcus opacus]MCZ4589964.1 rhamnulokinase [Rhodococcus opacus]WLF44489.1 rhamnulokinase family protein [Rhodococcus opacus]
MPARVFGAVDIGASSGRVIAGVVDGDRTTLHTVHRFTNGVREQGGHLRWDITGLYREVLTGLRALAAGFPEVESIGIDTWAVDYGLLDAEGNLLSEPISYRDGRTDAVVDTVHGRIDPQGLYGINGLQYLPFNTVYQLAAEQESALWDRAAHIVLLPDLLAYWLTGELRTETTNASTTGLLDVRTGTWSRDLLTRLDIPRSLLPPLQPPGEQRGLLRPELAERTGLSRSTVVTTVGSHDTASAVVAVPATVTRFAYISSGTWSLAGVELAAPVLTQNARRANFTNEGGVDRRTRFLRNVGGLWLLQESLRTWTDEGRTPELDALLAEAATLPAGGPEIDVDDAEFIRPGDMPTRICSAAGLPSSTSPAEVVRCILDSLATAYRDTIRQAVALTGAAVEVIHIVGGGSQNALLCQLTADRSGLPVIAGPVEATALGNVLVQARARGAAPDTLEEIRHALAQTQRTKKYLPSPVGAQGRFLARH